MKAIVDQDACIGCGVCVDLCPEVFQMNADGKSEALDGPADDYRKGVEEAKGDCPAEAINTED